jgi:hypothetical protein
MPREPRDPSPETQDAPRRHGGRRPGAGAKKGNLNALKSGKRSKRLKALVTFLMISDEARELVEAFARRNQPLPAEGFRRQTRILQGPHRQRSIKAVRDHLKRQRDAISPNDQTIKSAGK